MLAMSSLPFSFCECNTNLTNFLMDSVKDALSVRGRCDVYVSYLLLSWRLVLSALSVAHIYRQFSQSVSGQWLRGHVGKMARTSIF